MSVVALVHPPGRTCPSRRINSQPTGWVAHTPSQTLASTAPLVICAMPDSDCPNGMCSRKPTGAAAETYGKPAAGKLEEAVFALG
jgi:hypothetical protein